MADSLRIIRLYAQNFKRLKVCDIRPKSDVVLVTGANGSGKTSVLDVIFSALGGSKASPPKPIRDGMPDALIEVDLGKYVVQRRFTKSSKQPPIEVIAKDGTKFKSPQDLLDQMLGDLTFDPLAFARMKPSAQAEELRRIAKLGPELDELDRLNATDYDERKDWNRRAKEASALAESIKVPADLPESRINVAVLAEQMEEAGRFNGTIEKRKLGQATHRQKMEDLRRRARKVEQDGPAELARIEQRRDDRVGELMRQIEQIKRQAETDLRETRDVHAREIDLLTSEADAIEKRLAGAEPIPEPKDTLCFKEQMAMAQTLNSGIDLREKRNEQLGQANEAAVKSEALTDNIAARTKRKAELIGQAKMPVPGLGLADGVVTYNGLPFEQASSAEQLRVSVGIAMAQNPTLRILRITNGSLLDSKSMAILEEMAGANDFQCWIECVDESGKIGIVMDDGEVVGDFQEKPVPPAAANGSAL